MASRPTNRRSAAAMMRSAEGSGFEPGPAPDTQVQPESGEVKPGDADPIRNSGDEPAASSGSTGPRYDSLVTYQKNPDEAADAENVENDQTEADAADDNELSRRLETIATDPGVYLLKDKNGKVLYVGKAKSLRSRVRAYFRDGGDGRFQVRFLMRRVRDFDTLVARSEKEALILENNLIKQYKPRYNIRLKDDKSYLSAKMTNHPWPRITVTRRIVKDGGRYFGPFGSADGLRETIDVIRKVFPLRTCSDAVF
jgi:GIY-YIG catalytic domain